MISIYMSKNGMTGSDDTTIQLYLCAARIDCNITPMTSVVDGKLERGFKIDTFNMEGSELVKFWKYMQTCIGVHCCWVEIGEYFGCILDSPAWKAEHEVGEIKLVGDDDVECTESN